MTHTALTLCRDSAGSWDAFSSSATLLDDSFPEASAWHRPCKPEKYICSCSLREMKLAPDAAAAAALDSWSIPELAHGGSEPRETRCCQTDQYIPLLLLFQLLKDAGSGFGSRRASSSFRSSHYCVHSYRLLWLIVALPLRACRGRQSAARSILICSVCHFQRNIN